MEFHLHSKKNWVLLLFFLCFSCFLWVLPTLVPPHKGAMGTVQQSAGGVRRPSFFRATSNALQLATFVADHMVLQREPQQSQIWGWASVGVNVTVRLNGGESVLAFALVEAVDPPKEDDTSTTNRGMWIIGLPPQPAGAGHTLEVSDGTNTVTINDVAFGDVFLCSGQSNMEFTVDAVFNASHELEDSTHYPNLRVASVRKMKFSIPQQDVRSKANSYIWAPSSPRSLQQRDWTGGRWGVFSAACYFFGRELYKSMDGAVPIGLVSSSWGGQRIEHFSSPDAMDDHSCGGILPLGGGVKSESDAFVLDGWPMSGGGPYSYDVEPLRKDSDSDIWNGMIHPLLPMRFSGVVWYQGEANADNASSYACRFPAMITDWRRKFDLPDLTFIYVELAAMVPAPTWPPMRAAQAVALQLPGVGMATAIDLGDPTAPYGAIHSRRKQEVGRRLALSMLGLYYQDPDAEGNYSGPVLRSAALGIDPAHSTATLSFQLGTTKNLHLSGTAECTKCCQEPPFEILAVDGSWKRVALAQLRDQDLVFLFTNEASIYGIRYAWEGQPECALYNGDGGPEDNTGLPAAPFQWCAYPTGQPSWMDEPCHVPTVGGDARVLVESSRGYPTARHTNDTVSKRTNHVPTTQLRLPTFVDSHMVLQRTPHKARIWGWASPGAVVTARLVELGVQVTTIADEQTGTWIINFPSQEASDGHSIHINDGQNEIVLEDIAFGDVFLCSGQSNMQMPVPLVFNATEEIADSIHYPNIRLATVALVTSDVEMDDVPSETYYNWSRASPDAMTGNATNIPSWTPVFSATCYFTGRELYRSMNGTVPIGLVVSSWGGMSVETFSSVDALNDDTCGGTVPGSFAEEHRNSAPGVIRSIESNETDGNKPQKTQLWKAMIHPLRHMRFAGALWYQGEANSHEATSYACRFPAMIADWRVKFDLPDLTFLYVELAGYTPGSTWPWVRAAQAAALSLPRVGRATAIDLGDTHDAPAGEIHPRRKQEVGRRLAWTMRAIHYGDESAIWHSTGPVWKGIQFDSATSDDPDGVVVAMTLSFEGDTAHGLYFTGAADCTRCCDEPPFHVLTKSGKWLRAESAALKMTGQVGQSQPQQSPSPPPRPSRVIVRSQSEFIYGIRYAWEPRPECFLYNRAHVPAMPWEWCVFPTGRPHWSGSSCGGRGNSTTTTGTKRVR